MSLGKCVLHTSSPFSNFYNYFEAQNISGYNLRETQTVPAFSLGDIFPLDDRQICHRDR